jgi:hypothetical protein
VESAVVTSLVGVYDADGTVRGEITYWLGARIGRAHCSLCDVTHGLFTQRSAWRDWRRSLGVPFELFHRDDIPGDIAAAVHELPAVLARSTSGVSVVLDRSELEVCAGELDRFVRALEAGLAREGLHLGI